MQIVAPQRLTLLASLFKSVPNSADFFVCVCGIGGIFICSLPFIPALCSKIVLNFPCQFQHVGCLHSEFGCKTYWSSRVKTIWCEFRESHLKTTMLSQSVTHQYTRKQYYPIPSPLVNKTAHTTLVAAPAFQYIEEALCANRKTVLFELCRTSRYLQLRFIDGMWLTCGWIVSERHRIGFGSEEAGTCVCKPALAYCRGR